MLLLLAIFAATIFAAMIGGIVGMILGLRSGLREQRKIMQTPPNENATTPALFDSVKRNWQETRRIADEQLAASIGRGVETPTFRRRRTELLTLAAAANAEK
jgi:hypothetical protein